MKGDLRNLIGGELKCPCSVDGASNNHHVLWWRGDSILFREYFCTSWSWSSYNSWSTGKCTKQCIETVLGSENYYLSLRCWGIQRREDSCHGLRKYGRFGKKPLCILSSSDDPICYSWQLYDDNLSTKIADCFTVYYLGCSVDMRLGIFLINVFLQGNGSPVLLEFYWMEIRQVLMIVKFRFGLWWILVTINTMMA